MNSRFLINWTGLLSAAGVFVAWTMTSFLCHECSKRFLMVSETFVSATDPQDEGRLSYYRFFAAAAVTTVQCCSCLLLTRMDSNMFQSRTMTVLTISHILATLATNYSMVFIAAASTLAIKLMEPITMAVAHHVVFRKTVSIQTVISIPLTVYGALLFIGLKSNKVPDTAGIGLAFASNLILAVRNTTLKRIQHKSTTQSVSLTLKPWPQMAFVIYLLGLLVAGMYFLHYQGFTVKPYPQLVTLVIASGVSHVAYSYISTTIVLRVMNVVSHSIANIFKRLLVVLLLSALGTRQLSANNFLGLGIAVAGLMVYTHGKINADHQSYINVEGNTRCKVRSLTTWLKVLLLAIFAVIIIHSVGKSKWVSTHLASARQRLYRQADSNFRCLQEVGISMDVISNIDETETDPEMREFLSWRLVDHPEDTDKRSKMLTTNREIIEEAQRILVNLMQDLLGKARHVILIDIPVHENKGDAAIAVGEILLLEKLNRTIVFHCQSNACNNTLGMKEAITVNRRYPKGDLVILMHGGGNVVGYTGFDLLRRKYIEAFPDRKCIIFSQSIWLVRKYSKELDFARETYSNRSNLVIFLRDRQSLEIAKKNFRGVKLILAPDLAFCIGMVPRQMPPLYDIVWLRRDDTESTNYTLPTIPQNITVYVGDWRKWQTNQSNKTLEDVFLIASEGFQFLQRGRIVVTDRLHGHILSTLLNIPHVIIDNPPYLKLSSFDKTWTQGLSNTVLVSNGSLAMDAALELLERYQKSLPSIHFRHIFAARS